MWYLGNFNDKEFGEEIKINRTLSLLHIIDFVKYIYYILFYFIKINYMNN